MSLNNLYSLGACSPSGYVYPPPGGLPPYFPVPGLGQVSKPPALSMLSPASGKMTPKTATVPPLSQGSPSNGLSAAGSNTALNATRTSSFAAALRKLAHQAKDPQEEAAVLAAAAKHNGSPINSGSPRSATPKRAPPPPPLVYTSQTATLNSPPVVTIAPTQTMSHPVDGRQSNDRVPSAHSTASSYDHYNAKHERDQRPHSSHSRDDDRGSTKDSSQTPTRLGPPHTSAGTSREEGLSRGFHPYRPEDDLHRAAAAAAATLPPYALDPAYAAYHPAFLQHHAFQSAAALRYEDPLMERLRLMQAAPFLPFPGGLVPHPSMHPLLSAGARYPAELLHQYPYLSPSSAQALDARTSQVAADRSKSEDERVRELEREKEREKEKREKEREREREREAELVKRERLREAEREKQRSLEHGDRRDILTVPSRYLSDREGQRDSRSHHQPPQQSHHQSHPSHRSDEGRSGSISQGTPRDADHSRPRSRTSEGSHVKNHHSSPSHRNHYQPKYENHSLPKAERTSSESSRHSHHHHHHPASHSEQEQSKGQPPPLVSPHRSSSKGSSDTAIFRPFEKDGPTSSASVVSHSDKSQSVVLVPPPNVGSSGKCNHVSACSAKEVSPAVPASVRVFGSTPEAKILNSNFINHRIEKFDFKSLARECASREASSSTAAVVERSTSSSKAVSVAATADVEENRLTSLAPQLPSLASLPSVAAVTPAMVVSRLDARERLLREARAEGSYNSESEEECELEEEMDRKRDRLTLVGSLVAADLVLTPCKVALFDRLGLTTLQRKKDLQQEGFRKRRKLMRERSISPIEVDDVDTGYITPADSRLSPEASCSSAAVPYDGENFVEACKFFAVLGLRPVPPECKQAMEIVRQACEDSRRRREEKRKAKIRRKLEWEQQELLKALNRKASNNKRKFDDLAPVSGSSLDVTIEPLRITLGQLQERHLAAARQEQEKNQLINHTLGKAGSSSTADGSRPVIFSEVRDRHLSREFAEQFHESVLQSTRQKEQSQKLGHANHGAPDAMAKHHSSINHMLPSSAATSSGEATHPVFPWPGIEGVLESYNRHRTEQLAERRMLIERCRQLHAENMEMNKAAEALSSRLQMLEEEAQRKTTERERLEHAIGSLKKCLSFQR